MNTTKITLSQFSYRVPDWEFCNCRVGTKPSKDLCRFCVEVRKNCYVCVLHNMPLSTDAGFVVNKATTCRKATAGFKMAIEEDAAGQPITSEVPRRRTVLTALTHAICNHRRELGQELIVHECY